MPRNKTMKSQNTFLGDDIIVRIEEAVVRDSLYGILVFSFLSVPVCLVWYSIKYQNVFRVWEIVYFIPAVFLMFCIYYIGVKIQTLPDWKILLIMGGIETILATLMILTFNTQPVTAHLICHKTAIFHCHNAPESYDRMY